MFRLDLRGIRRTASAHKAKPSASTKVNGGVKCGVGGSEGRFEFLAATEAKDRDMTLIAG